MTRQVQSNADRDAIRAIRQTLRDCGIDADASPPYEAPIPVWHRTIVFGDPNEGRYPYELHLEEGRVEITDNAGDPVAMAGLADDQRIAGAVALATEVTQRDQYLDDDGESLEGRCGTCNRNVTNFSAGHRVTSVLRGGKGVECTNRADMSDAEAAPLKRMGAPQ